MFVVIIICLNFSMFYLFYSRSKETKKKGMKKKEKKKTVKIIATLTFFHYKTRKKTGKPFIP